MIDHILVALDGSALAECVLPHMMAIAHSGHTQVTLLHVMEYLHNEDRTSTVDPGGWHLQKRKMELYLEQLTDRLQDQDTALVVDYVLLEGNPAERIIEFARNNNVDLIALSSHGRSGLSGWNVSSVVQKILARSHKSILLVRAYKSTLTDMSAIYYKRLFVGLDGSPRVEYILPMAISLAQFHQSEVILGTVI